MKITQTYKNNKSKLPFPITNVYPMFFLAENSYPPALRCPGGGVGGGGRGARGGGCGSKQSSFSQTRRAAQLARDHARSLAYYVPPRPSASLHGGRRSDVPASALLGTGGYNILTTAHM
ncbi:jg19321 [Pararge aegeria aegeria]|uniref:Jg19321 protein n=1 Tax=Pararge aegeria aegeria TaxID=348720 RepID=A0A8S4S827_9NEOP|nr:jg19321 [Pararge aegeria aegeria]